jgi:hypothetical protein
MTPLTSSCIFLSRISLQHFAAVVDTAAFRLNIYIQDFAAVADAAVADAAVADATGYKYAGYKYKSEMLKNVQLLQLLMQLDLKMTQLDIKMLHINIHSS